MYKLKVNSCKYENYFQKNYYHLLDQNENYTIDIAELSVHLKDCSVSVAKLYTNSIADHIAQIFEKVSEHFVHLTKGLSEMPNEIFVPVFEEHGTPNQLQEIKAPSAQDFYNYWGLYFDNNNAMDVYELRTKSIVSGDFFLLG